MNTLERFSVREGIGIPGSLDEITGLVRNPSSTYHAFHDNLHTPILKNRLGDSAGVFGAAWIGQGKSG